MIAFLLTALLTLPVFAIGPQGDSIAYRFEGERFLVSRIEMRLSSTGEGTITFTRKGLAKPIDRSFRVSEGAIAALWAKLDGIDFLGSSESYQSKSDHSNLGTITVAAARGGASREATFNFSSNREMWSVATTLRGIASREIYAFDLETAQRYQPLQIPALLDELKKEVSGDRISDASALLPLLRNIAEDYALPVIAQNRAKELADLIEKRSK